MPIETESGAEQLLAAHTSGASSVLTNGLFMISATVTLQSFAVPSVPSNMVRISAPVDPEVQPHASGIVSALQSRAMIGVICAFTAGRIWFTRSVCGRAPPTTTSRPVSVSPVAVARASSRLRVSGEVELPSAICRLTSPGPPVNLPPTILPASAALVGEPAAIEAFRTSLKKLGDV